MKQSEAFELRKRVGDLDALFGVKDYTYNDGPAKGMRAFDLNNGRGVNMTVLADRGLDIAYLTYKGVNMGFASKSGLSAPAFYVEDGARGFLKQFGAGLMTTCGITYSGAPCEDSGRKLGLHGPYSNTPARTACARTVYEGDEAVLEVTGEVREACMFGENMSLNRVMKLRTESDAIELTDRVANLGFEAQPVMLTYHINFGYPMLDAGAKVYSDATGVTPRDEWAKSGPGTWGEMEAPEIGRAEQCYFHEGYQSGEGFAMLHNEALGMAAIVTFDAEALPLLCEWKCMMAGDYALGLEPTTAGVMGRAHARSIGKLPMLAPGEEKAYRVSIRFTDDAAVIDAFKHRAVR